MPSEPFIDRIHEFLASGLNQPMRDWDDLVGTSTIQDLSKYRTQDPGRHIVLDGAKKSGDLTQHSIGRQTGRTYAPGEHEDRPESLYVSTG